jgi:hypothetical protein
MYLLRSEILKKGDNAREVTNIFHVLELIDDIVIKWRANC